MGLNLLPNRFADSVMLCSARDLAVLSGLAAPPCWRQMTLEVGFKDMVEIYGE